MKSKILKNVLAGLSGYVLMYVFISFVLWNHNVSEWSEDNREFLVFFGTFVCFIAILIVNYEELTDDKKKELTAYDKMVRDIERGAPFNEDLSKK